MAHVGLHHLQTKLVDHAAQFLHALLVGGDLRLEVGQVLLRISGGELATAQQVQDRVLLQDTLGNELDVVDLHPLFLDAGRERGHGAGGGAANVGMVATAAHIERRGGVCE